MDTKIPGGVFEKALYNTVNTMTGLELDTIDCSMTTKGKHLITGAMILASKNPLLLLLTVDRTAASILVSYMTGIEIDDLTDEDLGDGITEFANIVAGSAKAVLTDTEFSYILTSPFTIKGDDVNIIVKKSVKDYSRCFKSNDLVVSLKIFAL